MPIKYQKKYHYIYKTTCIITNKFYIGMHSTNSLDDKYLGSGKILKSSIKKYGKENHRKEILELCSSRDELESYEKEIVNKDLLLNPYCINLKCGGEGGSSGQSLVSKKKISESNKGRKLSPEQCKNISMGKLGKTFSEKHRENIRKALKGKIRSEESRKNMSVSQKGKPRSKESIQKQINSITGKNNPMYGKGYKIQGNRNGMFGKSAVKGRKWYVNSKNQTIMCFSDDIRLLNGEWILGQYWRE